MACMMITKVVYYLMLGHNIQMGTLGMFPTPISLKMLSSRSLSTEKLISYEESDEKSSFSIVVMIIII